MYLKSEVSQNSSGLYSAGVERDLLGLSADRGTSSEVYRTLLAGLDGTASVSVSLSPDKHRWSQSTLRR
jgi:hypothetical protein